MCNVSQYTFIKEWYHTLLCEYFCTQRSGLTKIDEYRLALEEIKFLQKLRERKSGVPAIVKTGQTAAASNGNNAGGLVSKGGDKAEGDGEKDDLVLQDTFALETAVLDEDPHMYVPLIPHYACAVFLLSSQEMYYSKLN